MLAGKERREITTKENVTIVANKWEYNDRGKIIQAYHNNKYERYSNDGKILIQSLNGISLYYTYDNDGFVTITKQTTRNN